MINSYLIAEWTALNANIAFNYSLNQTRVDEQTKAMANALRPQHHYVIEVLVLPLNGLASMEEIRKLDFVLILELSFCHENINQFHTLHPSIFLAHCINPNDEVFELEFQMEGLFHYFLNMLLSQKLKSTDDEGGCEARVLFLEVIKRCFDDGELLLAAHWLPVFIKH